MRVRYPFLFLLAASAAGAVVFALVSSFRSGGDRTSRVLSRDRVALVEVAGVIAGGSGAGPGVVSARDVVEEIDGYAADDSVKALVLRVDSPGGGVAASQEIHAAVARFRSGGAKTVVVSMGGVGASGGYYIACGADRIFANPGTITGSIGVIMEFPNFEKLLGKIGVSTATIKSGAFKDIGNPARPMTPAEREFLQALIDDIYGQFVDAVAAGRGLDTDEVKKLADGKIFSGRQAKELGLVDELGDLEEAIASAGRLAGLAGKPTVVRPRKRHRLWDILQGRLGSIVHLAGIPAGAAGGALYLWR